MKKSHVLILKAGFLTWVMILLVIISGFAGSALAARVAGGGEEIETTAMPDAAPEPAMEEAVDPAPEPEPVNEPSRHNAEMDAAVMSPDNKDEKRSYKPIKVNPSQKYVTLDFDNVDVSVLVKFVSELTEKFHH